MPVKYVSFGAIIDDIVMPDGQTHMGWLGGGGPQTAWGMALAAGSPGEVGVLAGIGDDTPPGFLAPLEAAAITLSGVHQTPYPTTRAWVIMEYDQRRHHVWRTDPQHYYQTQVALNWDTLRRYYPQVAAAHWGLHPDSPNLSLCPPLRERGALVSIEPFEPSHTPMPDQALGELLGSCDVFSPNWFEAARIFGTQDVAAMVRRSAQLGGRILVLRLGADGSEAWDVRAGRGVRVAAAPPRQFVDPVGAGNTYCGAFAAAFYESGDLGEAAASASAAASYLLEQIGIPPQPPTPQDFEARREFVRKTLQPLSLLT